DEVNFWQPSGSREFRALRPGELFLFKLHAPDNVIVGGGIFGHASNVPLSLASEAFGPKNGAANLSEMRARIVRYRRERAGDDQRVDPIIGCRMLTQSFFWPSDFWIRVPASWSPNIVSGKGFQADERDGLYLWNEVTKRH